MMKQHDEIIIYRPDDVLTLDVRVEDDTVWLTQAQMAQLFMRERSVISRHINNIFKEGELEEKSNVHFLHIANADRPVKLYNLDVIISVGYRVKSVRGTQFRQWANKVLKEYLLRGYSVNRQMQVWENRVEHKLYEHEARIDDLSDKVDFFIRTSLPPKEGILFEGQIFDAHRFVNNLIRTAKYRIILIDNYVDDSVLVQLDNRTQGVEAKIYTLNISHKLSLDIERHNAQYPAIEVKQIKGIHDRFMIIDDNLYHIGASIKDLGKRLFAFSKMDASPEFILDRINI